MSSSNKSMSGTDVSVTYVSPSGRDTLNPDPDGILAALMTANAEYWEAGSGDAALRRKVGDQLVAEVILMVRDQFGVFVQYVEAVTGEEYVLADRSLGDADVVIQQGGDPWELPRRYFVSRDLACSAIDRFLQVGDRLPQATWERF